MQNLENTVFNFLRKNCTTDSNYGIGYSGGGDSKALLHLLVRLSKKFKIQLHVLHLDHSWREESKNQADLLQAEIEKLGLGFHRDTLKKSDTKSNLEDVARKERISFFSLMAKKLALEGIFLAHHGDDLAETVLKRTFEGAQLENISGMQKVSSYQTTVFFRPLLNISKEELKKYLKKNNISAIDDPTNYDHKFLRARMRGDLFPLIEKSFGKSIKTNLIKLSERSDLLNSYLDGKLKDISLPSIKSPFGSLYEFYKISSLHLLEKNYILSKIFQKEVQSTSSTLLAEVLNTLELKGSNKKFFYKNKTIISDRGVLFFIDKEEINAKNCSFSFHEKEPFKKPKIGWKFFWEGSIYSPVPCKDIDIKWFEDIKLFDQKKLLSKWERKKVPAFLRRKAPILCQNGKIIQDVLDSELMFNEPSVSFFEWKIII